MIETVTDSEIVLAYIIRHNFHKDGVTFFTPDDYSQQLAYMSHPKGKEILPHRHNLVSREVHTTQEVLFIKTGRLRVNLFNSSNKFVESKTLEAGDFILLASGGHGFEVLEDVCMIEIKQGPYAGDKDKEIIKPNY